MNNKYLKSILQNRAEQIAPGSKIDLWPSIQKRFASHQAVLPTYDGGSKMKGIKQNAKVIVPIVLALILVAALVVITPQGRALANTVIRFFTTTDQSSFPVSISQPPIAPAEMSSYLLELVPVKLTSVTSTTSMNSEQSCEGAELLTYACQVAKAEAKVSRDAREFPADPQGVAFSSVEVNSAQGEIKITYDVIGGGGWLDLRQGTGEIIDGLWERVPTEAVEAVLIGDIPGEYVQGVFTSDGSGEATWDPNAAKLMLRWHDGERWFSIEKSGNPVPIEYLGKEEMIILATSLVDNPHQAEGQLRAEYLTNITDAETISGIDLIEPTLLPAGFKFSFAQYDAQTRSVRFVFDLSNHPDDAKLIITETPLEFVENPDERYSKGDDYATLSWITDDLFMTIFYSHDKTFGGQLNKAKMVEIAESMR